MLDFLSFRNAQCIEHADHSFGTEKPHQIVFQRNIELGFTGVALSAGTAAQLIVDTPRLMPLRTDDLQTACRLRLFIQFNIRTTSRHIGRNCNSAVNTGIRYDFRFQLMKFGIQNFMLNASFLQKGAQFFRSFDRDRTDQHGLPFAVRFHDRIQNRIQFFSSRLIYRILSVDSGNRFICRNLHNVHAVNITELFFFRQCGTCHARFFLKFIKKVLESDCR